MIMMWYSVGNTREVNTMPLSLGAPQMHASGTGEAPPEVVVAVKGGGYGNRWAQTQREIREGEKKRTRRKRK